MLLLQIMLSQLEISPLVGLCTLLQLWTQRFSQGLMGLFVSAGETGRMLRGRDGKHLIKKNNKVYQDLTECLPLVQVHCAFMEMWLQLH